VARSLDSSKFQTLVVSPRSYFAFTPLLASTAVGTLEFRTALEPVRSRRTKVDFFQGWADDVDFKNRTITIEEAVDDPKQGVALTTDRHAGETPAQREAEKKKEAKVGKLFNVEYDKLIVTVGCYSQTFGTPGVKEHAFFLKDVGDARRIRNRILACFEGAALPTTSVEMKKQLLNFAVVGGGPTGIEFSAELHDLINEDMKKLYPELVQYHKITVYDVAEKVLPMFDQKLAGYAMQKFKRRGIDIKTSHHVEELRPGAPAERSFSDDVDDYHLYTLKVKEEGEIGVGMCVWSEFPFLSLPFLATIPTVIARDGITMLTNPPGTGLMQNLFVDHALSSVREAPTDLYFPSSSSSKSNQSSSSSPTTPNKDVKWIVKKDAKSGSIITDDHLRIKLVPSTTSSSSSSAQPPDPTTQTEAIHPSVFALGDCGIIQSTTYPATAQVASQKAFWLAKRLNKGDLSPSSSSSKGFTYRDLGTLAYIGDWNALFQGGGKWGGKLQGYVAWIIWRGAYLTRTVSWRNKVLVPVYWLVNWLFGRDISRF
jgi:NADH dehydrogenase FAD-containing subunit